MANFECFLEGFNFRMGREEEMAVDLGFVLNLTEERRVGFGGGDGGESRGGVAEM